MTRAKRDDEYNELTREQKDVNLYILGEADQGASGRWGDGQGCSGEGKAASTEGGSGRIWEVRGESHLVDRWRMETK